MVPKNYFLMISLFVLFCGTIAGGAEPVDSLVINEVMSNPAMSGDNAGFRYSGSFIRSDWVEIYNPTEESVDLTGLRLSDDCLEQDKWEIKAEADLEVPPQGYVVIWCPGWFLGEYNCGTEDQPRYCPNPIPADKAPFRLNAGGEWIGLYKNDGKTLIDGFHIPSLGVGRSYGCRTDGCPSTGEGGGRSYLKEPTPSASNSEQSDISPEIQVRSYRGIVYGEGDQPVDYTFPPIEDKQDVRVRVEVIDADDPDPSDMDDNIEEVILHWKVMGFGEKTVEMAPPEDERERSTGRYEAVIPGQDEGHAIAFYVEATDKEDNTSKSYWSDFFNPDADPPVWFQYPVGAVGSGDTPLVINEVLASNPDTPPWYESKDPAANYDRGGHDHGAGSAAVQRNQADDWVELYNPGDDPLHLRGCDLYLTDNELFPRRFYVGDAAELSAENTNVQNGSLPAGKHLLIWCDGEPWQNDSVGVHTPFRLAAAEDDVLLVLYRDDNEDWEPEEFAILEVVSWGRGEADKAKWFGPQDADWSIGRYPDGGENWGRMLPTCGSYYCPGAANSGFVPYLNVTSFSPVMPTSGDSIKMVACVWDHEKLPYNEDFDQDGWAGVKLESGAPFADPPVENRTVAMRDDGQGGDMCADDGIYTGTMESGLSNLVTYKVTAQDSDGNKVVFPQGASVYGMLYAGSPPEQSLVITEVMAATSRCPCEGECDVMYDADGDFDDWVEIYNPTESPVYLGDYYLTDRMDWLQRWRFPWETAGSSALTLGPGERVIVWCDAEQGEQLDESGAFTGEFHTNFRLAAGDDEVFLVGGSGDSRQIIDYVELRRHSGEVRPEDKITNVSFGYPEGSDRFGLLMEATPGESNEELAAHVEAITEQGTNPEQPQRLEPGSQVTVTGEALERTEKVFLVPLWYEEPEPNLNCELCVELNEMLSDRRWNWEAASEIEESSWEVSGGELLVTIPGSLTEGQHYLLCVLSSYIGPVDPDARWPLPWYEGGVPWTSIEFEAGTGEVPVFRRGDVNNDGKLDIADATFLLNAVFVGESEITCPDAADVNDEGLIDISDAIYLLNYMFAQGPSIPPPPEDSEGCGIDPTSDSLSRCIYTGPCE